MHPPFTLELGQASPHVIHSHLEELVGQLCRTGLEQLLQVRVAHHGVPVHQLLGRGPGSCRLPGARQGEAGPPGPCSWDDLRPPQAPPASPWPGPGPQGRGWDSGLGTPAQAKPVQDESRALRACCPAKPTLGPLHTSRAHGPGASAQSPPAGLGVWRVAVWQRQPLGGSSAHFLSPREPPTKRPSELPALRVLKAWGAVPWSRPRQGLPGRGRGSGSPQIKGLAETCQPLAPQPGCPHPQGTQEGTASLLIGSKGDGNYKAGPALLVVHGLGGQ